MADYPSAAQHFVPTSFMFDFNDPKAIVIHKTAGDATPADVYQTFINSPDHRSAHYAIGQDGSIWQFVPELRGAGANGIPGPNIEPFWTPYRQKYGNLNKCTISIEHCDPSPNNDTPLTDKQKAASFALVAHLCQKYAIPAANIKPHRSIAATSCPGNYPMTELIAYVVTGGNDMLNLGDPFARTFFTGDDNAWHCARTGQTIIGGILDFYRKIGGSPRLPVTGEKRDVAGIVYQVFESGIIVYDPAGSHDAPGGPFKPCYLEKLDSGLAKSVLNNKAVSDEVRKSLEQIEASAQAALSKI